MSYREAKFVLFIAGLLAIGAGVTLPKYFPLQPNDPSNTDLTFSDNMDSIFFELLKLLGGAALVAGSVSILQDKIQRERDAFESLGADLLNAGVRRVYKTAESREFTERLDELIESAQYEIVAAGLGNSYLAHSGRVLQAIRERLAACPKLNVSILFAEPKSPALRERIREENAYSTYAGHFIEKGWEYTFYDKIRDELANETGLYSPRVRISRLPFFVMSAILRVDQIALIQPYGTPTQPGGKCPWLEVDLRDKKGFMNDFVNNYLHLALADDPHKVHYSLILLRHGQSEYNRDGRVSGNRSDPRLTPDGESQIKELSKRLRANNITLDFIASGTHLRDLASARILLDDRLSLVFITDHFDERYLGPLEGLSYEDLARQRRLPADDLAKLTTEWSDSDPVESDEQIVNRVMAGLRELPQAGTVGVVTSANVILALLRTFDKDAAEEGVRTAEAIVLKRTSDGHLSVVKKV